MTAHLFKIGTIVSLNFSDGQTFPKASSFIVEALMPPVGTSLQYRIKSQAEGFSRVVVEHQLSAAEAMPTAAPSPDVRYIDGEED